MSTDTRRSRSRRRRGFGTAFLATIGILAVLVVGGSAASLAQGPRLTGVQSDPAVAIEASGSRVILTANQVLADVSEEQVEVTPAVPFTVDASGRSVGVRFTVPLEPDTVYTVAVRDARGLGGGPTADLETDIETPAADLSVLRRAGAGDDAVFRTGVDGSDATPIFTHPHIEDFRAGPSGLVVSAVDDERSVLFAMDRDGGDVRELALPGDGTLADLQLSDRGGLVGYLWSDAELTETSGRASVLMTQPLRGGDPTPVTVAGDEVGVVEWEFVPDAAAVLLVDFDGTLLLADTAAGGEPTALGTALTIDGIFRGTYTAIVERLTGVVLVDLTTGKDTELTLPEGEGEIGRAMPVTGGLLWQFTQTVGGVPSTQQLVLIDDEGTARVVAEVPDSDGLIQSCVSPSGSQVALTVAPGLVDNPFDLYRLPVPEDVETRIVDLATGDVSSVITGFALSWCRQAAG